MLYNLWPESEGTDAKTVCWCTNVGTLCILPLSTLPVLYVWWFACHVQRAHERRYSSQECQNVGRPLFSGVKMRKYPSAWGGGGYSNVTMWMLIFFWTGSLNIADAVFLRSFRGNNMQLVLLSFLVSSCFRFLVFSFSHIQVTQELLDLYSCIVCPDRYLVCAKCKWKCFLSVFNAFCLNVP